MTSFPRRVLLATDGSEEADLALQASAELSKATGSEVHVVYVEPLPDFMKNDADAPTYDRQLYKMIEAQGKETLRKPVWRVKVACAPWPPGGLTWLCFGRGTQSLRNPYAG